MKNAHHARAAGLAACFASTLLFAAGAHAQGAQPGWRGLYVGGGGTYSNVSVEVDGGCYDYYDCWWGDYDAYDDGDGDYGYSVHVGLRVHEYVALEASYLDTGSIRWDENLVYFASGTAKASSAWTSRSVPTCRHDA